MQIASIGIDLGKTNFHLVALGERSKVLVRKKFFRAIQRPELSPSAAATAGGCLMAMENWKAQTAFHFSTATTTARSHSTKVC
jgi:hypothetical protein